MKTRSIRYVRPEVVELIEEEVAEPGIGEVQVQGLACGICAWDIFTYKHGPEAPPAAPPGHEGVGRILKLGKGVKGVREGARVLGRGFAGLYNMQADQLALIPENSILPDEHWIIEPVACVVTGIDHCQLRAGDRVAVVGCGYMGLMMIQILGRSFVDQLIAIDIDPRRLELAKKFGATQTINSSHSNFKERMEELKLLSIDTTVDTTGVPIGLEIATKITRPGGRINLFGWNHGPVTFDGTAWHMQGFTVINSSPSAAMRNSFVPAIRLLHRGIIDHSTLVTHVAPLDKLPEVLAQGAGKTNGYIKGVIKLT